MELRPLDHGLLGLLS